MAEFDKNEGLGKSGFVSIIKNAGDCLAVTGLTSMGGGLGWSILQGQFMYSGLMTKALIAATVVGAALRQYGLNRQKPDQ